MLCLSMMSILLLKIKNILIDVKNDKLEEKNIYNNIPKKYLRKFKKVIKQRVSSL